MPPCVGILSFQASVLQSQQAASDATPTEGYQSSFDEDDNGDNDGNDEDPGEGTKRKATSSASGGTASSEELVADEGGMPSPTKRGAEARGSTEPSPTRILIEEPPAVVEARPEKLPKVSKVRLPEPGFTDSEAEGMRANAVIRTLSDDDPMSTSSTSSEFRARIRRVCSLKSVRDVGKFLKKEELKYNDDEEVDIEEFGGLEAEIEDEKEVAEDYDGEETLDEEVPTWSLEFEEGPPKLEEHELEAVDRQSRKTEIERLMDMKVLKPISEAQATSGSYKHLSTKIVYDWRHSDGQWKRRGRLVAREFRWLTDYDLAALFSPTGVASTVKLLSALFVSTDHYSLGSVDIGDAYRAKSAMESDSKVMIRKVLASSIPTTIPVTQAYWIAGEDASHIGIMCPNCNNKRRALGIPALGKETCADSNSTPDLGYAKQSSAHCVTCCAICQGLGYLGHTSMRQEFLKLMASGMS